MFRNAFARGIKRGGLLRNIRMQNKLILAFLALSLVPLAVSAMFSVNSSSKAIKEKIGTYSQQLVNQVSLNINTNIQKIKSYSDDIIISPEVNNSLTGYRKAKDADKTAVRFIFLSIMQLKFLNTKDVDDVLMVFNADNSLSQEGKYDITHLHVQSRWKEEDLNRVIQLNNDKENLRNFTLSLANIGDTDEYDIIVGRKIGNSVSSIMLGHLFVAVNQNYFRNVYKDIDIGKGADIFILDADGTVVSSDSTTIPIGRPFEEPGLIERINLEDRAGGGTFSMKIGSGDKLIAYSKIEDANWYIISTIPYSYLNSEASKLTSQVAVLTIVILVLAIIVSFIISQSISAPLKKLERNMAQFGEGKLIKRVEVDRLDEIGRLQKSFNTMATDIRELLVKIDEEHKLRRMTELKILEYQINPHFLYNTLDSINWMAQKAGQQDIGAMVTALARFFRLGLSKGKETYTVKDEIEHVHNYLIISKIRYKDCFEFDFRTDPSVLDCKTLRILLQPLAENAIKHGINKNGGGGRITIGAARQENAIVLEVRDNGRGIGPERLEQINGALAGVKEVPVEEGGFGLLNVNQRIKLHYGESYGIFLESKVGEGTAVKVVLPVISR